MFSPLRQAASAQLLGQGSGKYCEREVWILSVCHGRGVGGMRELEMVTVTFSFNFFID